VGRRPPIPSQQPPAPKFSTGADVGAIAGRRDDFAERVQRVVDSWAEEHDVPGVVAGVRSTAGDQWVGASATREDGEDATPTDTFDIQSVTKLLTGSLVLRAVDRGLVDLDAPLPTLTSVPEFSYATELTPRELLTHRSGLVSYRDTPGYAADPARIDSPEAALRLAATYPLTMVPGERYEYSSTNYLVLGLLLEQVTGRSFDDLFDRAVISRFGLTETTHLASGPGEPRGATAGVVTTMPDLLRATQAVLGDEDGVSAGLQESRLAIDPDSGLGLGTMGYCPCSIVGDGEKEFFSIGYTGGRTFVATVPTLGVTVGIDIGDSLWIDDRFAEVNDLATEIARLAAGAWR
jgi:CubicO group peptidase (beta-lactamase class C family)